MVLGLYTSNHVFRGCPGYHHLGEVLIRVVQKVVQYWIGSFPERSKSGVGSKSRGPISGGSDFGGGHFMGRRSIWAILVI